jgi:hypothetical protein
MSMIQTVLLAAPSPLGTTTPDYSWLAGVPWQKALNYLLGALAIGLIFALAVATAGTRNAHVESRPGEVALAKKRVGYEVFALVLVLVFGAVVNVIFALAP